MASSTVAHRLSGRHPFAGDSDIEFLDATSTLGAPPLENLVLTHVRLGQYDEALEALQGRSVLTPPAIRPTISTPTRCPARKAPHDR